MTLYPTFPHVSSALPPPPSVSETFPSECPGSPTSQRPRPSSRPAPTGRASPALTLDQEGLAPHHPCLVAHPLGAALARDLSPPGVGAVPAGQPDILAAQGHAGEAAVLTAAANPAVGLEGLPVPVPAAVHLTAAVSVSPCGGETGSPSGANPSFPPPCPRPARLCQPHPPHGSVCRAPDPVGSSALTAPEPCTGLRPGGTLPGPRPACPGARGNTADPGTGLASSLAPSLAPDLGQAISLLRRCFGFLSRKMRYNGT